ncbi:helix-turn-helix transcriptional regulator [Rhodococcoides yunnanense]|uniref:helix-turn-helix transcriptional regulator n=1 Tax=Rhodococcoides yunnanense TaxID=278209 RepID=UPI0009352578|nr:helix-turn-helix transcriptional regulator [Rhodococcus yunnanensis]
MQCAADKIARMCAAPRGVVALWQDASAVLAEVVPYYRTPCWFTVDPASLLMTSHYHFGMDEFPSAWLAAEYCEDDVQSVPAVIRSRTGLSTLHEAADGDPSRSPRWQRNRTLGGDQELITRLCTRSGETWGALTLYREEGAQLFTDKEKAFLHEISPVLAGGARRALLYGQATEPEYADSPGLLVLDDEWNIESATPGVDRWMADLPGGDWASGELPVSVIALAARVLHSVECHQPGEIALSRVLSRSGAWLALHGACLSSTRRRRVAVIIEPAHPSRLYPLLMSAYGLTEREKEVTAMVLQGSSTSQISAALSVSAYTVQKHLDSIFAKTGVRSRRDLVSTVFFRHCEPRLRDNEKRTVADRPVRGGPWPTDFPGDVGR